MKTVVNAILTFITGEKREERDLQAEAIAKWTPFAGEVFVISKEPFNSLAGLKWVTSLKDPPTVNELFFNHLRMFRGREVIAILPPSVELENGFEPLTDYIDYNNIGSVFGWAIGFRKNVYDALPSGFAVTLPVLHQAAAELPQIDFSGNAWIEWLDIFFKERLQANRYVGLDGVIKSDPPVFVEKKPHPVSEVIFSATTEAAKDTGNFIKEWFSKKKCKNCP